MMAMADPARRLRIALVAPLWTSVPPAAYGGTELVVHLLAEDLVRRGHDVTLFASGDSRTGGRLRPLGEHNLRVAMERGEAYEYEVYATANLVEAIREADRFDVIHSHLGFGQIPLGVLSRTPVVHTLHTRPALDDLWVLSRYPEAAVVAVSRSQVEEVPAARRRHIRVIHHGIDFDAYEFSGAPGGYLAFLGRMGPQKSPLTAIEVARAAGMPLLLAGVPQNAEEEAYFAQRVQPLIDGKDVRWIGAVDHARKNELLRGAAALLFPIQGGEAFGLAMIEAMACGTPVVGWGRASVPEVIDPGRTGFFAGSVAGMTALVPHALALDRQAVRAQALRRFSHRRMVDDYLRTYEALNERAHRCPPP
jgi:glycosyltransferase involved in cell wall biosynthesis